MERTSLQGDGNVVTDFDKKESFEEEEEEKNEKFVRESLWILLFAGHRTEVSC
jgi:hypothetical protein